MKEVYDFIINALPWVAIGLFVACSIVSEKAKKDGKKLTSRFKAMCWSPAVCFLFVAVMEMSSGNRSSGTTWLILCVFNAMINFANTQKSKNGAEKTEEENSHE